MLRENWQGAATAASGLAAVGGMNERLEATWAAAENPDDHLFKVPETTAYDPAKFDEKGRCVFNVGKPKNENCLACHGVSQKGMPSHAISGDVHLQRGMRCVDCHQNGMDHRVATKSCASCHVEKDGAGPKPVHAGIPLVHFQKLACTVCHAGVTEGGRLAQVRTARANRIGVYGRAQWATDCPVILEPVFVKNAQGVVEPRRMMWPSGFHRVAEGGALKPVPPTEAAALAGEAFTVVERVTAALELLKETDGPVGVTTLRGDGVPVYRTPTNDVPYIAAEDRAPGEFRNLLATLFNAKVGVSKEKVAACRAGKVYMIDGAGGVTACEGVSWCFMRLWRTPPQRGSTHPAWYPLGVLTLSASPHRKYADGALKTSGRVKTSLKGVAGSLHHWQLLASMRYGPPLSAYARALDCAMMPYACSAPQVFSLGQNATGKTCFHFL